MENVRARKTVERHLPAQALQVGRFLARARLQVRFESRAECARRFVTLGFVHQTLWPASSRSDICTLSGVMRSISRFAIEATPDGTVDRLLQLAEVHVPRS